MGGWLALTQQGLSPCKKRQVRLAHQRTRANPPCGLRSVTKLDLKRTKSENTLTGILDSKVGFSEWLGSSAPLKPSFIPLLHTHELLHLPDKPDSIMLGAEDNR